VSQAPAPSAMLACSSRGRRAGDCLCPLPVLYGCTIREIDKISIRDKSYLIGSTSYYTK